MDVVINEREVQENIYEEKIRKLIATQEALVNVLAILAETRDNETGGHIIRTSEYIRLMSNIYLKHSESKKYESYIFKYAYKAAPLHDIGKVSIPDTILLKPSKLTDEEFTIMKNHTTVGYWALQKAEKKVGKNNFIKVAKEIAYTHHEKWDGTGYPRRLIADEIPIHGRMMALADVYDALISKKVYKAPISHSKALKIIEEGKGKNFDPLLVELFVKDNEEFRKIAYEYADYSEEKETLML